MRMIAAALALGLAPGVLAQTAAGPECAGRTAALPPELAGWRAPAPLIAAVATGEVVRAPLPIGRAVRLSLSPTAAVRYAATPEKPEAGGSHGGMASFAVDRPGLYRVALGSGAWVDVVRDGKAATSVAHGHGPACSGVRKMVDFRLTPGRHLLQVAGEKERAATVMVTRLP